MNGKTKSNSKLNVMNVSLHESDTDSPARPRQLTKTGPGPEIDLTLTDTRELTLNL